MLFTQSGKKQAATGFPAKQETPTTVHLSVNRELTKLQKRLCGYGIEDIWLGHRTFDSQVPPHIWKFLSGTPQYPQGDDWVQTVTTQSLLRNLSSHFGTGRPAEPDIEGQGN